MWHLCHRRHCKGVRCRTAAVPRSVFNNSQFDFYCKAIKLLLNIVALFNVAESPEWKRLRTIDWIEGHDLTQEVLIIAGPENRWVVGLHPGSRSDDLTLPIWSGNWAGRVRAYGLASSANMLPLPLTKCKPASEQLGQMWPWEVWGRRLRTRSIYQSSWQPWLGGAGELSLVNRSGSSSGKQERNKHVREIAIVGRGKKHKEKKKIFRRNSLRPWFSFVLQQSVAIICVVIFFCSVPQDSTQRQRIHNSLFGREDEVVSEWKTRRCFVSYRMVFVCYNYYINILDETDKK